VARGKLAAVALHELKVEIPAASAGAADELFLEHGASA
jgi:hypothetical protein